MVRGRGFSAKFGPTNRQNGVGKNILVHDSLDLNGVAVVIPALNEEASLPLVLGDLPAGVRVVVVDNGSSDRTPEVAVAAGAEVIQEPRRGYGSACLAGIAAVQSKWSPQVIVFLDGDYSDHPDLLPQLVAPILQGEQDFILGSRLLGQREAGAMPPQSVFGNHLACFLMRWMFGAKYTDLGPFRAIHTDALQRLKMQDTNYGWTIEMQIKAHREGLRYLELAVPYRRRIGTSKISGTVSGSFKAGVKILLSLVKYGF